MSGLKIPNIFGFGRRLKETKDSLLPPTQKDLVSESEEHNVPLFDETYTSPNFSERRSNIDSIIIHHTAGLFPGCAIWLSDPEARASAHVIITVDGLIYKLIQENKRAWHAGRGAFDANKDGEISYAEKYWNDHSIGIELEAVDPYHYTPDQLRSLYELVDYYIYKYSTIIVKQILGHKEIAPDRKIDPANFDMDDFREKIKAV